jgi:hypothetical protein
LIHTEDKTEAAFRRANVRPAFGIAVEGTGWTAPSIQKALKNMYPKMILHIYLVRIGAMGEFSGRSGNADFLINDSAY